MVKNEGKTGLFEFNAAKRSKLKQTVINNFRIKDLRYWFTKSIA